jgi:hypothetical protein
MNDAPVTVDGAPESDATAHEIGFPLGRGLTPGQFRQQQRRQRALQLRHEGRSFAEIARELGWSGPSGASYAVSRARKELHASGPLENADEIRALNYERLNALLASVMPRALGGIKDGQHIPPDLKYARQTLRIIAEITDLMGARALPEQRAPDASRTTVQRYTSAETGPAPILDIKFDKELFEAARRKNAAGGQHKPISVDQQPPAGYIAPRPTDTDTEIEPVVMEPNSVDPVTGVPVFDPRVAIKLDGRSSGDPTVNR